ncbi:Tryptophan synthase beta subunit-like PLP-dependent enzymes superfamily [Penicillium coprophilum]|uniref:Tryptophan synthase beta subunit-like PLP-dependent enzymes superfamily n=1 Tax=Penicillium coprophilum TaxID=36646 RepID=UPI0023987CA9|nr:Tryptophan synthase beta subunit-like PLP-dependent enzymes superfamily [Penicillium coprophilum]KAJ5170481.1 Tryptophan synthase beta subunit-like PLP-dependent enzymes superfamily [Penicillium coprophilum]
MGSIEISACDQLQLKTPWIETPLVESACLSRAAGCRIFLKLENVQPSGSFKSRAMGNQILSHLRNPANVGRRIHFYASSGGNAGLAAVCAARSLGYPCTVVVPMGTKPLMLDKIRAAGAADVIRHGETFSEAGEYMREAIMKTSSGDDQDVIKIALHPFDNQPIWEGNSTIIDELETQLPPVTNPEDKKAYNDRALPLDAILCSVGGGGLLNGLVMGIEKRRQKKQITSSSSKPSPIHLLAIETAGTDSLAAAIANKSLVSLPKITSQATSLGAVRVSETTFQYAMSPPPGIRVHSTVLSDADAARGVLRLANDERLLVELACGVCIEAAIGDAATAVPASVTAGASAQSFKKRKRDLDVTEITYRDEGYGDDRSTSTDNDTDQELEPEVEKLNSKLKQLVPDLNSQSRIVIIVCGGSYVTIDMACEWRKMLDEGWA